MLDKAKAIADFNNARFFRSLRAADAARQVLWNNKDAPLDLAYRANELAGEVGEACNVAKKIERETRGMVGSRASLDDLTDELADVVICVDLLALGEGLPAVDAGKKQDWAVEIGTEKILDLTYLTNRLAYYAGRVSMIAMQREVWRRTGNSVEKLGGGVDSSGTYSLHALGVALGDMLGATAAVAAYVKVDLAKAVARKFNKTSAKVGLPILMVDGDFEPDVIEDDPDYARKRQLAADAAARVKGINLDGSVRRETTETPAVAGPWQDIRTAPDDTWMLLRGQSGYGRPYVILGRTQPDHRPPRNGKRRWLEASGEAITDMYQEPSEWARYTG